MKIDEEILRILNESEEVDWKMLQSNDDTDKPSIWKDHIYKYGEDFVVASSYNQFFSVVADTSYSGIYADQLIDTGKTLQELKNFLNQFNESKENDDGYTYDYSVWDDTTDDSREYDTLEEAKKKAKEWRKKGHRVEINYEKVDSKGNVETIKKISF